MANTWYQLLAQVEWERKIIAPKLILLYFMDGQGEMVQLRFITAGYVYENEDRICFFI